MMDIIAPNHRWCSKLLTLLDNKDVAFHQMGFPGDWQNRKIWQMK
ncbi:MAG: hypothetical protein ACJAW3_001402 [Lentimonas sp.]|jgi:hypothetical protein